MYIGPYTCLLCTVKTVVIFSTPFGGLGLMPRLWLAYVYPALQAFRSSLPRSTDVGGVLF